MAWDISKHPARVVTEAAIKQEIREKARGLGADLVSFLSLDDYHSPHSPDPRVWLPSARSVVLLGFRQLYGAFATDAWSRMHSYLYSLETAANYAGYLVAKHLEDEYRIQAFLVPLHRPFEMDEDSFRAVTGILSLRHVAVQSGVAVWGRNTLALTPQYGPRQFFLGILTGLEVATDPSQVADYNPCPTCSFPCVEGCPAQAFTAEGKVLHHRCVRHSQPHDPGHLMRFLHELADLPEDEERKAALRSARFFNMMQFLEGYLYYRCHHCTHACPALGQGRVP